MRINRFLKQFNWRFLLVRILVNALALAVTAAVTPKIYFVDRTVLNWLLMALMLGVLNALIKPVLQFLTLQFIFVTYGLVIVLVNALLLWLLSFLFPARFAVDNVLWALVGGLVLGLFSSFLESLLGLTMPIVPDELRPQVAEQVRHIDWRTAARRETAPEEQTLAIEPPDPDASTVRPAAAEPTVTKPPLPGPGEEPSPPEAVEAEPPDPVTMPPAEAAISSEAAIAERPEPTPDLQGEEEEEEEDGS